MKRIYFLATVLVISLLACGKNTGNTPSPDPNQNGGTKPDGGTKPGSYKRIDINAIGGNIKIDDNSSLQAINLGDANISTEFRTLAGVNTSTKTSLVHAEGAVFDNTLQVWGATWPNYNASDSTKRPYIRTIVTDGDGNVTEYRAYIGSEKGAVYWYANKQPATMNLSVFTKAFESNGTQKVLSFHQ